MIWYDQLLEHVFPGPQTKGESLATGEFSFLALRSSCLTYYTNVNYTENIRVAHLNSTVSQKSCHINLCANKCCRDVETLLIHSVEL